MRIVQPAIGVGIALGSRNCITCIKRYKRLHDVAGWTKSAGHCVRLLQLLVHLFQDDQHLLHMLEQASDVLR